MTDLPEAVETTPAAEEFIAKIWQERRRFVRESEEKEFCIGGDRAAVAVVGGHLLRSLIIKPACA